MVLCNIVYQVKPPIFLEERESIKKILREYTSLKFPFQGTGFFVSATADVTPEGIENLLNAIKDKGIRCDELKITTLYGQPIDKFLKLIPEPYNVQLTYSQKEQI